MGLSPYVFYREPGPVSRVGTTTKAFITNCQIDCSAEEYGNAIISGANTGDVIASNRFNGFNGNRSAAFSIPGAAYNADLYAPNASVWFNDFVGPSMLSVPQGEADAAMECAVFQSNTVTHAFGLAQEFWWKQSSSH